MFKPNVFMLINVKMPTILTFMSMMNFINGTKFDNLEAWALYYFETRVNCGRFN